jgi:hypothetical protein
MLPITEINVGDQFENPMLRPDSLTFIVMKINKLEKMIQVQSFNSKKLKNVGSPFWKKNTDRMFSENWRVFNMKQFLNKR